MARKGGRWGMFRAVTVARRAPMTIWPSPPMLITLALKEMQMPTPTSRRGMDFTAVRASPSALPKALASMIQ